MEEEENRAKSFTTRDLLYLKACASVIDTFLGAFDLPGEREKHPLEASDLENCDHEDLQKFVTFLSRLYNRVKTGKISSEDADKEARRKLALLLA